jgi:TetR/AcrR family transcriptional regulator
LGKNIICNMSSTKNTSYTCLKITQMGKSDTEHKIIQAATDEFIQRGLEGGRMRAISERAGINKGLIHYYFKSKELLFAKVFETLFGALVSRLNAAMGEESHLFEKVRNFVSIYIDAIQHNPLIPRFIISELNRNPERMFRFMSEVKKFDATLVFQQAVRDAVKTGEIDDIDAHQLFTNMLSMCIFPFIGRPMIQFVTGMSNVDFESYIEVRKTEVAEFIIRSIQKQKQ